MLRKEIRPFYNTFKGMSMFYGYPKKMDKKSLRLFYIISSLIQICFLTFVILAASLHVAVIEHGILSRKVKCS
nr:unnamed protein product [Callosobruchus analis]